ncbi:mucin-5AC [Eupeodes corollae]|uniref:mucin-5AC n=1 Tax=Eupeodes corollae TaxID=290404 RepID=UPI0024937E48|nr:mucin-5AC [Eupeodes corollae]
MDTVYGTKKYFQSLSAGSDIYRSSACRAMTNDYSYQNTLGRRSTLGAYYHMNKQPSFTNEHSLGSQYGGAGGGAYSTWGMWRDGRNIAPSTFSAKPHHPHTKTKSFSIILSTAAFIVLLAVISIAGLAFYFSSIKSNMEDTVIGFEGSFRIAKGDLFTTGLKYNHTTTYKQKVEYYKRFVERSLTDNALQPIRVDVAGFGDGPLIKVSFRTYLDVRKLPQNIHSVEEYIKESLFLETTALKSLYRSLRIDPESVEVKRILDEQLVKSASLSRDTQTNPTSQTQLEKRLLKKGGFHEKPTLKTLPNASSKTKLSKPPHSVDDEPDVDVENAPVIQGSFEGSFEITKTDADITQKKASPTKAYSNTPKSVTPFPLRVKPKKPSVEKVSAKTTRVEDQTTTTTKQTTTKTTTTTTSTTNTTPKPTTTTTLKTTTTTTTTTTPPPPPPPTTTTLSAPTYSQTYSPSTTTVEVPKLDANLFTSAPVLDTQPWRPIRGPGSEIFEPPIQIATQTENVISITTPYEPVRPPPMIQAPASYDPYPSGFFSKPNFNKPENREDTNVEDLVYYHGYSGPVFMPGIDGIEPLGSAHVKPHPLPNPLIDDVVIPAFKPLNPTLGTNGKIPFAIEAGDEKFEHLGGGVIVKKHDNESSTTTTTTTTTPTTKSMPASSTTAASTSTTSIPSSSIKPKNSSKDSQITDQIGEFLMDLLNLPDEDVKNTTDLVELKLESRIEPDSEERPNFMNLKEIILQRNRGSTTISAESSAPSSSSSSTTTTTTTKSPGTKRNRIRPSRPSKPFGTLDDSALFPSQSKWEFVNGSSPNTYGHTGSMRRVFNKTLQAWVSEDVEKAENLTLNDIKTRINNATNIQDISLIFDTLASKLGITHSMPTKIPPFSHNKLKISQRNETKIKLITTTTMMPTTSTTTTTQTRPPTTTTRRTSTTTTTTPTYIEYSQVQMKDSNVPTFRPLSPMLPEVIEGEAEVEVIDPNKYEEMLKSSQVPHLSVASTTELPRLVTLLPVRSNSGIRTFRPLIDSQAEGRRLTTPSEAVVKSGIHVTV